MTPITSQNLLTMLFLAACIGTLSAEKEKPIFDEEIHPVYFEDLVYPLRARLKHIEGVVVVRVQLDTEGRVVSAIAVSGAQTLIGDCVSNAKKWRFRPNDGKAAIIVYEFRIRGLCNLPCASQFTFRSPNLAYITMGEAVVDHN